MATIQDVKDWYERDLGRFAPYDTHVEVVVDQGQPASAGGDAAVDYSLRIRIFTDTNCYNIVAKEHAQSGYLGCISRSRKLRAGEDWTRGRDLPDGPLTEETWREILANIVSYEMVRVHKPDALAIPDQPQQEAVAS
jgi:hypothetical protein